MRDVDGVRHVGADDREIGVGDIGLPARELGWVFIEADTAKIGIGKVAVAGVPGTVRFKEVDIVAAVRERLEEGAVGGGVAVAPG